MSATNDSELVGRVVARLAARGVDTWIFGGWAEEIHGMSPSRVHGDIDLLYPAADFSRLDGLLESRDLREIAGKRFPHKRAFVLNGVMVELFLVQRDHLGMYTDFWGFVRHRWPDDTLLTVFGLRAASKTALLGFRADHDRVHEPRPDWLAKGRARLTARASFTLEPVERITEPVAFSSAISTDRAASASRPRRTASGGDINLLAPRAR